MLSPPPLGSRHDRLPAQYVRQRPAQLARRWSDSSPSRAILMATAMTECSQSVARAAIRQRIVCQYVRCARRCPPPVARVRMAALQQPVLGGVAKLLEPTNFSPFIVRTFVSATKRLMVAWRSTTHRKTARFSRCLAGLAKNPSTALSHEHEVDVRDAQAHRPQQPTQPQNPTVQICMRARPRNYAASEATRTRRSTGSRRKHNQCKFGWQ